jgi:beta-lactamase regulating signal transducer with metallopeptidase domain
MQTLVETAISNALVASALALVAFAVSRWRRPALAHGLWLLVLLKLVTPPLLPVYLPAFQTESTGRAEILPTTTPETGHLRFSSVDELTTFLALTDLTDNPEPADVTVTPVTVAPTHAEPIGLGWQDYVMPLWISGAVICIGLTLSSVCRFQWLLHSARPAPRPIQNQTSRLAARLGLERCPQVCLVPGAVSPMIWAIGAAPRLLFPAGLLDRLDEEQRAALLLHELAHVRRRDHWVRFVELLVVALYWWHPVVWWARRELREAEEQCCDAWVVWASSGEGTAYARALLETVAFVSRSRFPLPASASGIGHIPHLRRRLTMIMQANTPRSLSAAGWLLLGLAAFALPVGARAQAPGQQDKKEQEIKALKEKLRALEEAGHAQIRFLEDAVILTDDRQSADTEKQMKLAADLKAQIAKKQAELRDLEAKLKAVLAGVDSKKAGKIKIDQGKGNKAVIEAILVDDIKAKVDQEKVKAEKAVKEAVERATKQLGNIELKLDGLDQVIQLDNLKDKLKLKTKDGKPIEVILEQLRVDPGNQEIIIKMLDGKDLEKLKKAEVLKKLDVKKLEGEIKGKILIGDKVPQDLKVIVEGAGKKGDDIEARLEKLMKELQQLQKEVKASKKQQVK